MGFQAVCEFFVIRGSLLQFLMFTVHTRRFSCLKYRPTVGSFWHSAKLRTKIFGKIHTIGFFEINEKSFSPRKVLHLECKRMELFIFIGDIKLQLE